VAKRQEGVVSYEQLRRLGITRGARRIKVRSGEWIKILPTVVRLYWADETWMQKVWAVWLWLGKRAHISHYTAAVLGGFPVASGDTIDVTSETLRGGPSWISVHRVRRLSPEATQVAGGIRVTSPAQTVVDLAESFDELGLEKLIVHAARQGVISLTQLREAIPRLSGPGKPGRSRLRRVVARLSNSTADRSEIAS